MKNKLPAKGLYAITPDSADASELFLKVEQALQGGIALLQYRDKTSSPTDALKRAKTLHALCLSYNVPLIINDDPNLAFACKAEGVHLGQSDASVQKARALLGNSAIIGVTCHHDISLAITAQQQGADYVAFGRFYHSNTKPGQPLATTELLAHAKTKASIPIVAIGGINHDNAQALVNMGADYIAVIEQIFSANDIKSSCQHFNRLFRH